MNSGAQEPAEVHVSVQIVRASGLAKADFSFTGKGASDPFCEVHWNGNLIHKTKVIDNNLNPAWEDETCAVGKLGEINAPPIASLNRDHEKH